MTDAAPTIYAAIPFTALVLLVALVAAVAVRSHLTGRGITPGMILWPLPFAALLGFVGVWCAMGLVMDTCSAADLVAYSVAVGGCGAITLARRRVFHRIDELAGVASHLLRAGRDAVLLVLAAALSVAALEGSWNRVGAQIPVSFILFAVGVVLAAMVALYFLGQRTGVLPCLVAFACIAFGIASHFVLRFKSAAILPSDLLAIGTAAAVSGNYTYELSRHIIFALALFALALCLLSFIHPGRPRNRRVLGANIAGNLCACGLVVAGALGLYNSVDVEEALDFTYDVWMPQFTYMQKGVIPSFLAVLQDLPIEESEGYDADEAQDIEDAYVQSFDLTAGATEARLAAEAQFNEMKPAVVAIMNESFSDLSIYEGLRAAGYTGPAFYNSLGDTLQRGALMSSVVGGGTCNTEFEFLTGNSMAFVGSGKYPYQLYDFSDVSNLAQQFDELGYKTTAIHPQLGSNWNRSNVYNQMGFDTFLTIDDFPDATWYHYGPSDRTCYDRILQMLREDPDPQFIFNVTMQNHGGYDAGTVLEEDLLGIAPEGITDPDTLSSLNTYLACIQASDRDLEYFINELRTIGRPVVLVFFGDHQPSVGPTLNEALYPGEDAFSHSWREFVSTYIIWANYDVAGNDQVSAWDELGANALGAQLLYDIGAPLSDQQKATLATRASVTSLNALGYRGADGICQALDANSFYSSTIDDLRKMQYLNFAEKVQ
ncbi:LTA synthase family protein [Collinsella sp. An2]|uniref:LTA synthase family protein n=1 Tax=Collinsella sp. An2 TaxID=1965585 RepID=UPI0013028598|nr:LTA synthase family protein [Collinsella sp. An2]